MAEKKKQDVVPQEALPKEIETQIKQYIADSLVNRKDGWSNVFVGLGQKKDKAKYTEYGDIILLDDVTLESIYMGDGLGGRIIDIIADDMTREWVSLDGDNGKKVFDELIRLEAEKAFNEAIKWQRLYGGALIVIGAMDGRGPESRLNDTAIKKVEYLKVIPRTDISISESTFNTNPNSSEFGKVEKYAITYRIGSETIKKKVHASRCIPFYNDPAPALLRSSMSLDGRYWGISSLQRIYEELRDLGGVTQSIINILYEFIIGKFKVSNLARMFAEGRESQLITRIEIMEMSKSILNAVILGEDEEYTRDYATLAGLPEVIDRYMLKLSGSTGIPVTRLFGRSPSGLNATGENDLRNYYDLVEANQRNRLFPPLRMLVNLLSSYLKVDPPEVVFVSLYQLDEKEKAEVNKLNAETEKIKAETEKIIADTEKLYMETEVMSNEDIRIKKGLQQPVEEPDGQEQ